MEVEIISKECIKPSSPTPPHLKNHELSFLDLRFGRSYIPLLLYYPLNQDSNLYPSDSIPSVRMQILKQSLSETLSRFYPLAGKIKDAYSIDCNDEGVYFVEAKVRIPLNGFLNHPNYISFMNKFLPDEGTWKLAPENYIAGVQVTTFSCGGIVVGLNVAHTVVDGAAFSTFLRSWSAIACKNTEEALICPKFDASSIFPYNEPYPRKEYYSDNIDKLAEMKHGNYVTRRYVFDASAIANLKDKATSSRVQNPTRVEVVAALFVKCIMASLKAKTTSNERLFLSHAVNLRRRAKPQFSEYYMGNFLWLASIECKDKEVELEELVYQEKEAIAKMNGDFVNSLQGEGGWANYLEIVKNEPKILTNPRDVLLISSWCNFGLYEIDFGWGKPAWLSIIDMAEMNFLLGAIIFTDTRERDGIEAWTSMIEEDAATLELDNEFLAFATIDPSPLE